MNRAERIWNKWAMLAIALMAPLGAQGLGLGEARVDSFLNQPLDVRMRLLDATADNLDSLTVAPADPSDYERLGLMAESLALRLDVSVDRSVSPPVVRVTSDRVVTDPVVQLLIDARWSSGRVLREYTLFLDPATVAVEAPAPAQAGRSPSATRASESPAASEPGRTPRSSSTSTRSPTTDARTQVAARSGDGRYGPVAAGETLWSIAETNLPSADVTMNQMMIAIVELNPRAFRDGNINRLLRGAELRLPDAAQARARDAAQAAAEVAAQNRAFGQRTSAGTPVAAGAGGDARRRAEEPAAGRTAGQADGAADPADEAVEPRLSLVPPGGEESGSGLSDQEAAEISELRQRLARAEEELYAARQESEEFQSRVEELESTLRDNAGSLGIRDEELAGLQQTLRAAREATREDADPAVRSRVSQRLDDYLEQISAASDGGGPALADASGGTTGAEDSSDAAPEIPEAETADSRADAGAASAPAQPETPSEPSAGLFGNPMLLLLIGLVVLLLVLAAVWFAWRRRTAAEAPTPHRREVQEPARPATDFDTPLARARARLAAQPSDLGAHLGVLQTLATDGNEDRFGDALDAMFEHVHTGDEPEWREALELAGRVTPGHPLVNGSSDWVADSERGGSAAATSDIDEDSEVDDLMSRLGADLDESDDRDWLGEDDAGKPAPAGPLLRDDDEDHPVEEPSEARDEAAPARDDDKAEEADDDSPIDFGDWGDADEASTSKEDFGAAGRDEADDVDDLILDWDDGEEKTDDAGTSTPGVGEAEFSGAGKTDDAGEIDDTDDDIFAQSDDDIDVKLDLAKAYLSWNSTDSARTLLEEVEREGNESQQQEARKLLDEAAGDAED